LLDHGEERGILRLIGKKRQTSREKRVPKLGRKKRKSAWDSKKRNLESVKLLSSRKGGTCKSSRETRPKQEH